MVKKMEKGRLLQKEKMEREAEKKATEASLKLKPQTDEDTKAPKSILKASPKVPEQKLEEKIEDQPQRSVKFEGLPEDKQKPAPKKAQPEPKEEEPPKRTSLFKQRMMGNN